MIPWLLGILTLITLASSKVNMFALTIFTIPSLLFYLIGDYIVEPHYLFAAVIDILIIYGLTKISKPTKLVAYLAIASLASILINLIGWIMYMMYLDPIAYEMAGVALYGVVIFLSLWSRNDGHANNHRTDSGVHRPYTFGHQFHFRNHRQ